MNTYHCTSCGRKFPALPIPPHQNYTKTADCPGDSRPDPDDTPTRSRGQLPPLVDTAILGLIGAWVPSPGRHRPGRRGR